MDLSAEVFVGREEALGGLRDTWADVLAGGTRIVCVSGEPGIGKTALVRRLVSGPEPPRSVWVDADEAERRLRFGVADRLLRALGVTDPLSASDELEMGAKLLQAVGAVPEPFVLVLDDLHAADPASQAALRFALRRLECEQVLVVLVTRPQLWDELESPLRRFLDDPRTVRRYELAGLTTGDITDLAQATGAGRIGADAAERLRAHTAGHPLHTVVLLRELGAQGIATAGRVLPAPRTLAGLVQSRVAMLPPQAAALLKAGAVLGATFPTGAAASMVSLPDPTAPLQDAVSSGLLEGGPPGRAAFSHPLVRAAVYNDLPPAARRRLHLAAAEATSGLVSLLHRADATDGFDDALAQQLEAAAAADAGENGTARCDLLLAAARCSSEQQPRDRRTVAAAEALVDDDLLSRAQALRPSVEACAATPRRELVLALLDARSGRFDAARARLEAALADTRPDDPDGVRARLLAGAALLHWNRGDFQNAFDAADEALRGDLGRGHAALTCYVRTVSLVVLGRLDALRDDVTTWRLDPVDSLAIEGTIRFHDGDIAGAVAALDDAVRRSRKGQPTRLFIVTLGLLAEALFRQGRWDDATLHAELAVSLARDTDAHGELLRAHVAAAEIHAARGRFDASAGHIDQADAFATVMPAWPVRARVAMARAFLAVARDDAAGLRSAASALLAEPGRSRLAALPSWRSRTIVAEAQLRTGAWDDAEATLDGLRTTVRALGRACAVPDLARLTGALAEARGRHGDALAAYAIDDATATAARSPLAVARLGLAHGDLQVRLGDRAAGLASLRAAHATFTALGAVPFLRASTAALVRAGVASQGTDGPPDLGLSPRQEAVALLVADGLTNKEIAAELYVSVKTVEYHLGQIFVRTGLRSRRELGSRMRAAATASRPRAPGSGTVPVPSAGHSTTSGTRV